MLLVDTLNNGPLVVVDLSKPSISIVGPILVVRDPLIDVKEGVLPLLHRVKGSGIETSDVKIVLRNTNSIGRSEHISADLFATGIEKGDVFHQRTIIDRRWYQTSSRFAVRVGCRVTTLFVRAWHRVPPVRN